MQQIRRRRRWKPLLTSLLMLFFSSFCSSWVARSVCRRTTNRRGIRLLRHPRSKSISHLIPRTRISRLLSSFPRDEDSSTSPPGASILSENAQLIRTVRQLEEENNRLKHELSNRIVLESFEGENRPFRSSDDDPSLWCDELENDSCPLEPAVSFGAALKDRAAWLVGLLLLQSASGIILAKNEALLANHPVMGAGGNAGNQASVRVIRGLALGSLNERTQGQFLLREIKMAGALSGILSFAGLLRTVLFRTPLPEAIAVTTSLSLIVFTSVCLGAVLPLVLKWLGVDPAHSSTTIQVVMDILGVVLAMVVSSFILDSSLGQFLVARLAT